MNPIRPRPRVLLPLMACAFGLLASGCSSLLLGSRGEPVTTYSPAVQATLPAAAPAVNWQLSIAAPETIGNEDGLRILVEPMPGQLEVYADARWAARPSDQLAATLLHALERSGRITGAGLDGSGLLADYRVIGELRRFRAEYAGQPLPSAHVEITLKLLRLRDQRVVAMHTFDEREAATDSALPAVNTAFERALSRFAADAGLWVLQQGQADWAARTP